MTPNPLQKGCWPDGSSGVKHLVRLVDHDDHWRSVSDPAMFDASEVNYHVVPVLPVELVEGLVQALEVITETPPMPETMRELAKQALDAHRQVLGEGDDGD